ALPRRAAGWKSLVSPVIDRLTLPAYLTEYFLQRANRGEHRARFDRHEYDLRIAARSHVGQRFDVPLHQQVLRRVSLSRGDRLGNLLDRQGLGFGVARASLSLPVSAKHRRFFFAFSARNRRLLFAFGARNCRLLLTICLKNQRSPGALGGHLF